MKRVIPVLLFVLVFSLGVGQVAAQTAHFSGVQTSIAKSQLGSGPQALVVDTAPGP
jgi:hypothetical protein